MSLGLQEKRESLESQGGWAPQVCQGKGGSGARRAELVTLGSLARRERREMVRMPWWEAKGNLVLLVCPVPLDQREKLVTLVLQDHGGKRENVVHRESRDPWGQGAPKESLERMK